MNLQISANSKNCEGYENFVKSEISDNSENSLASVNVENCYYSANCENLENSV